MRGWILVIASVAMIGCSEQIGQEVRAEQVVRAQLKDPSSAKFDQVAVFERDGEMPNVRLRAVCGWVNARNGFGGYAGAERFIFDVALENVMFEASLPATFDQLWSERCSRPPAPAS